MTPLKRVLLAIALLVSWHLQERALGNALVNDISGEKLVIPLVH